MRLWKPVALAGIILLLCFVAYTLGSLSSEARAATSRVEYKMVEPGPPMTVQSVEAEFNRMGAQGWQLAEWGRQPTALFKRP